MNWPLAWRLGAAVTAVIIGVSVRYFFLGGLEGRQIYITLSPAVAVAAVFGGVFGGLLATFLSALAALALSPALPVNAAILGHSVFFISSAIIIGITKLLRMALQRTAADDLLRQSEEQLSAFVEHAPAAMAMFDANMRYLALSARWRSDFNLDHDVVGESHYDVYPKISNAWKEVHRRGLLGETLRSEGEALAHGDGAAQWLRWAVQPWRDPRGKIGGIIIFSEEITDRVRSQEMLRDSQRQLKAVFETSMEGIVTVGKRGVIQAANPAAAQMFGYETDEMLGRNVSMLMPATEAARHESYIAKYLRMGDRSFMGRRRKLEGLRKNGEVFSQELTLTDASNNGDVLIIGFMRDLTQIENEKRRTEAAQAELLHVARLSDMGEVAAGLAHEVSQPLTAIRTLASVGRRAVSSTTDPSIAQLIDVIETQAKNASDILKRLRGFIEKRESRRQPENLTELIEEALALASVRSNGRPVRIVSNLSPEDVEVDVDRIQILQVLVNFLRNASDAMADQPDPEVVIETILATPGVVRVNVSDNGPGVDPKIADRLFTPFVTTKSFGMGVGLSLCKTIIESHKGEIGCAANTPKGATFWFTLPVVERAETADVPPSTANGAVQ
jgi:two-component system sensor kinase FixL